MSIAYALIAFVVVTIISGGFVAGLKNLLLGGPRKMNYGGLQLTP